MNGCTLVNPTPTGGVAYPGDGLAMTCELRLDTALFPLRPGAPRFFQRRLDQHEKVAAG